MSTAPASDPRYPIGKFQFVAPAPAQRQQFREACIAQLAAAPAELRAAVAGLSPAQLDAPYREGGWTLRQVVHHVPDSHLNAYLRFRLALTEDQPLIRAYEQQRWAELPDAARSPVEPSLDLLDALHRRWLLLLNALPSADFERQLRHPEQGLMSLDRLLALYAWHGRHHVAHITTLRLQRGW